MTDPKEIVEFSELLRQEFDDAIVTVDSPREPKGEYWLDVSRQKFHSTVSWRPKVGFGIFVSDEESYGERPDELYARPGDACTRMCQLIARSNDKHVRAIMQLKELRHIVGQSQVDLASELDINQAAISRMENREDMHVSSLHGYITAMGGELEMRVRFKDFEAKIEPVRVLRQKARG